MIQISTPIEFKGYQIQKIDYQLKDEENQTNESSFEPSIEFGLDDELKKGLVTISVEIQDSSERIVKVVVNGSFDINKEMISNEDEIKKYLAINGSAILLPYVRSIISMITSLDSPKSLVMPTVNVLDLMKDQ